MSKTIETTVNFTRTNKVLDEALRRAEEIKTFINEKEARFAEIKPVLDEIFKGICAIEVAYENFYSTGPSHEEYRPGCKMKGHIRVTFRTPRRRNLKALSVKVHSEVKAQLEDVSIDLKSYDKYFDEISVPAEIWF